MELQEESKESLLAQPVTKKVRVKFAQYKAAQLLAEDLISDEKIAEECGVSRRTLARWKLSASFDASVKRIKKEFYERFVKRGLARQDVRCSKLDDLMGRYETILRERGAAKEMQEIPGGKTGLIVKTYKGLGSNLQPVFEVDNPTAKAMQDIMDRYADEVGDKVFRSHADVTVSGSISARMAAAEEIAKKEAQRVVESKTA